MLFFKMPYIKQITHQLGMEKLIENMNVFMLFKTLIFIGILASYGNARDLGEERATKGACGKIII